MSTDLHDDDAAAEAFTPPAPKKRTDDELDMTPMVDVTFLLLIFFMVTAAFAIQKVLEVPPVNDDEVSAIPVDDIEKDSIVVKIDADNIFWISAPIWPDSEEKAITSIDMRAKVRQAKDGDSNGPGPTKMMVQAHEEAVYEKLVDAIDAGSAAEINEISVAVVEDEDF
ncbi:ExbD/TolR family protein [Aeoliella mucimassa]|uniref:Biopolymer transport protein ExbD/TolR n=1 Tax=Aeoliella mucimassa TaxID=2527972 RepID=A0A518AP58_9BACT|nr:biopolymer transporter ExbD [Aeoliella mucimassa]QDU56507.1 Biopolymer transport protein ExbD/TolR [Aeoliella mucimassa]